MKPLNITYKKPLTIEENESFRLLAIKNNLYVKGWSLINFLENLKLGDVVNLAFEDEKPVGICYVTGFGLSMFFVKEDYRGFGIAKRLAGLSCSKDANNFALKGIPGSETFFNKVGLRVGNWDEVMDFYPN